MHWYTLLKTLHVTTACLTAALFTSKVLLLLGYIIAGRFAMRPQYRFSTRLIASILALAQLALIFWLALNKPMF